MWGTVSGLKLSTAWGFSLYYSVGWSPHQILQLCLLHPWSDCLLLPLQFQILLCLWKLSGALGSLRGCCLPGNGHLFYVEGKRRALILCVCFWNVPQGLRNTLSESSSFFPPRLTQPLCICSRQTLTAITGWIYCRGEITWELGFNVMV